MEDKFWILNTISAIATIYFIISVPTQIIRRFKRIRNGDVVSPIKLILKKILQYWLITAVVLMTLTTLLVYEYLESIGASNQVIGSAIVDTTMGNTLTSLVIAYALMMFFKYQWSYSAYPQNIEEQTLKTKPKLRKNMEMLSMTDFLIKSGSRVPARDMSPYNDKPFQCACGEEHLFMSYMDYRNFGTTGANAKIMVTCPENSSFATLIHTKYKFFVVFDKFVSLAGCKS